jgi:hypothetical protein
MELEQQIQILVENAVDYEIAPVVIEKAIAPILKSLAQTLEHLEYHVWQNLQEDWIISVISSRKIQKLEKKVIYAFATVKDAKSFDTGKDADLIAIPIPTIQILFQVFSLQQVDSIIFFNQPGNITQGIEIQRRELQNSIQQQLLRLNTTTPPHIA